MEEQWDFEFLSRVADSCLSFLSEFVDDWLANDMRVSIFKILLSWLIFSLIAIHFAWKVYGNTVNDMYYRQGSGQNGGTPDVASHFSAWESQAENVQKSHRD
ncbi:T-cell leukemia translocation-altered gene protein homolog [Nothobranchius furzeri]|uniref:T-cell leukemia translocation-altered gene protein homolog n=1 Tax=Nothobranchius furzeri TaxID=105023 RepID=A0A8C6P6C6_NOTFU|nr:T-cell leukemia translocation-altered gene protein homolog [Nothobranchius furzeri]KAF7207967.1 T-cell leukemia translocation altered [Nothobranchius furzeri]